MQHYLKFLTVLLTLTLLYMPSDKKKNLIPRYASAENKTQ
jgi:hypothetical protein